MTTFDELGLPRALTASLASHDITEPFPVQAGTIPDALAGRDVSGKAPTGSGKTLAFGLPVLATVEQGTRFKPRALMLAPTRELAEQIKRELLPHAKSVHRFVLAVYGGVGYGPQEGSLRRGIDVLIATPGRLEDLIERGSVDLSEVDRVVIDEADRMADMGFLPPVRRILDQTSSNRQTLLFSATLDGDIATLARDYQTNPVLHEAPDVETEELDVRHHFWRVDHHDRVSHTGDIVRTTGRAIVFTRTRHGADRLAKQLGREGVTAVAMHGGRSQGQRNRALKSFTNGEAVALIATDVAARGIHVDNVEAVVHYDPPADHKDYLHRSGRTGRAGATGTVVTLVTGEKQRAVKGLLRELDLDATIGRPNLEELPAGAAPAPKAHRSPKSERPRQDRPKQHASDDQDRPQRRRPNGQTSVYVANLPWSTTSEDLDEIFRSYGKVHNAIVMRDRRNGRSKGFGFVDMGSGAKEAIADLNGADLGGRDLTVREAHPRS